MSCYQFGQLQLDSDIPLSPFLFASEEVRGEVDLVKIRRLDMSPAVSDDENDGVLVVSSDVEHQIYFKGIAHFSIKAGNSIDYVCDHSANIDEVKICLLGPVLACLCYQRSIFLLHASAINIDNKAVVLAGHSGVGKSTAALAFSSLGYEVLSDELLQLNLVDGNVVFDGGLCASLIENKGVGWFDKVTDGIINKSVWGHPDGHKHQSVSIERLYLLGKNGRSLEVQSMSPMDKLRGLVEEASYRYHWIRQMGLESQHARFCSSVIEQVDIKRIFRPEVIDKGEALANIILEDLRLPGSD